MGSGPMPPRLEDAEQERAIAADDERTLVSVQHLAHTRRDRHRRPTHLGGADYAGVAVASRVADAGVRLSGVSRRKTLNKSGGPERGGRVFLAPSGPLPRRQAQGRGSPCPAQARGTAAG